MQQITRNMAMQHELTWVIGEQELSPIESYFSNALRKNGLNVRYHNIHSLYPEYWRKASNYFHRLPRRFDNRLHGKYVSVANQMLVRKYNEEGPSLIFIYNDCLITPDTIACFRKKNTKVVTLLGDDPGYLLPGKKTFLLTALNSDAVIVPDSGWIPGLSILEAKRIIFSPIGTDPDIFYPVKPSEEDVKEFGCDVIFIGTGYYLNSWGIKRAHTLNALTGFDFKLFGDKQWLELVEFYPALKKNLVYRRLRADEVNRAVSCSKIYPVTVNSGVVNGVSTRVFDCMASGIFVLPEYKSDLDQFFTNDEVDSFKTVSELKLKTEYYLSNERERLQMAAAAREKVIKNYTLEKLVPGILNQI